jgi:hypothetical protein
MPFAVCTKPLRTVDRERAKPHAKGTDDRAATEHMPAPMRVANTNPRCLQHGLSTTHFSSARCVPPNKIIDERIGRGASCRGWDQRALVSNQMFSASLISANHARLHASKPTHTARWRNDCSPRLPPP